MQIKRRNFEFKKGELVLVKLQPYRQHLMALRKKPKLKMRYFGPILIIKKTRYVAYKLLQPATTNLEMEQWMRKNCSIWLSWRSKCGWKINCVLSFFPFLTSFYVQISILDQSSSYQVLCEGKYHGVGSFHEKLWIMVHNLFTFYSLELYIIKSWMRLLFNKLPSTIYMYLIIVLTS